MSKLLIFGAAPLPAEHQARRYAASLRTWQFAKALLDDGHSIRLIGCRLPNSYHDDAGLGHTAEINVGNFEYLSVAGEVFEDVDFLQQQAEEFRPDAFVGITTYVASRVVQIETQKPVWCDLHGWIMAEAQTKAHVYDDDQYLSHFWRMEKVVLERADVISTVSEAQAHAVVGELAVLGRLTKSTLGYRFTYPIPTATHEVDYTPGNPVIRSGLVPPNAFVVLWVGGYNTWTDVDLLYSALAKAMREVPELHFVSTGGAIDGHDDITFTRFKEMVAQGELRGRFHFVGWVPTKSVPSYYKESDLGINIDSPSYEAVFGARTRLNEMMHCGLPLLTTLGTEISQQIANLGIGLYGPTGDAEALAERMVWATRNRHDVEMLAQKAHDFVSQELSYAKTTEMLRLWARSPWRAPDLGERARFEDIDLFQSQGRESGDRWKSMWLRCSRLFDRLKSD
jgi:glycosyltransferase involved in cell wall biosynthesis